MGAGIAGHDHNGVLEAHRAARIVRQTPVLQDLQQDIEHIRVRLFDLVQEHHAVGLAPHRLGKLAALLIAHIAGSRADEP